MAKRSYPAFLAAKRESGEYTDFTLVCQGQELRVHKLFVCGQSPMMAAAIRTEFEEAKTDALEVNFDLVACQLMIDFLYTGDYSLPESTSDANQLVDVLRCHLEVNTMADYYQIDPLCQLSTTKFQTIIEDEWSADIFTTILEMEFRNAGNVGFYKIVASVATAHLTELSTHAAFSKLEFPAKFTAQLLLAASYPAALGIQWKKAVNHKCRSGVIPAFEPPGLWSEDPPYQIMCIRCDQKFG
ncbi:hypothetical protein HD806DRAFT_488902 [Xylariaceae sp. AK1471]|nr:hypothetical protein HD806DRAFT_488902 [Xylariaceae sp. AK1471]